MRTIEPPTYITCYPYLWVPPLEMRADLQCLFRRHPHLWLWVRRGFPWGVSSKSGLCTSCSLSGPVHSRTPQNSNARGSRWKPPCSLLSQASLLAEKIGKDKSPSSGEFSTKEQGRVRTRLVKVQKAQLWFIFIGLAAVLSILFSRLKIAPKNNPTKVDIW